MHVISLPIGYLEGMSLIVIFSSLAHLFGSLSRTFNRDPARRGGFPIVEKRRFWPSDIDEGGLYGFEVLNLAAEIVPTSALIAGALYFEFFKDPL